MTNNKTSNDQILTAYNDDNTNKCYGERDYLALSCTTCPSSVNIRNVCLYSNYIRYDGSNKRIYEDSLMQYCTKCNFKHNIIMPIKLCLLCLNDLKNGLGLAFKDGIGTSRQLIKKNEPPKCDNPFCDSVAKTNTKEKFYNHNYNLDFNVINPSLKLCNACHIWSTRNYYTDKDGNKIHLVRQIITIKCESKISRNCYDIDLIFDSKSDFDELTSNTNCGECIHLLKRRIDSNRVSLEVNKNVLNTEYKIRRILVDLSNVEENEYLNKCNYVFRNEAFKHFGTYVYVDSTESINNKSDFERAYLYSGKIVVGEIKDYKFRVLRHLNFKRKKLDQVNKKMVDKFESILINGGQIDVFFTAANEGQEKCYFYESSNIDLTLNDRIRFPNCVNLRPGKDVLNIQPLEAKNIVCEKIMNFTYEKYCDFLNNCDERLFIRINLQKVKEMFSN